MEGTTNKPTHFSKETESLSPWDHFFPNQTYSSNHDFVKKIKEFQDCFSNYSDIISVNFASRTIVTVSFSKLIQHCNDDEMSVFIKQQPQHAFSCIAMAIIEIYPNAFKGVPKELYPIVRLLHFDKSTLLKEIKAHLIGRLVCLKGTVVRVTPIKPVVQKMSFLCNVCREIMTINFYDGIYNYPQSCPNPSCKGRQFTPKKGAEDDTTTIDWQRFKLQEKLDEGHDDAGRVPGTIDCEVVGDLVDSVIPGDVVTVIGVVRVTQAEDGKFRNKSSMLYLTYVEVNNVFKQSESLGNSVQKKDEAYASKDETEFSLKDLFAIQEIGNQDSLFRLLVHSLCPSIYGHELVKAGILLALFGGRRRHLNEGGSKIRSDSHVLIVGDPGMGKSQMLTAASSIAPRGVYVCGNATTTSGLTVTLQKEGNNGDYALEAGALVLADQGACFIDEFDKMGEYQALLEAMEQQSISVAKAGIVCTLPARTSIIAAANPAGGHYNKGKTVSENLRMNGALLSRFDLIFILLDKADEEMDRFLSGHVMKMHSKAKVAKTTQRDKNIGDTTESNHHTTFFDRLKTDETDQLDLIPSHLLRKYIAYAKKFVHSRLSPEAGAVLQNFYLSLRAKHHTIDSTPITTRQLESLIRLSEARAKSELRETVSEQDALEVVEMMKFSLRETYENGEGQLDFQRSQMGTGMSKKNIITRFVGELQRLTQEKSSSMFTYQQLYQIGQDLRLPLDNFNDFLDTLNHQGFLLKKGNRIFQLSVTL